MEQIRSLAGTSMQDLYAAWDAAFKDYVRTWTMVECERMWYRRGFEPALSFGAFDGDKLVAFTMNAIRTYNGLNTAYDTGTGTIEEYRGKGLATKIFQESLPALRAGGTEQYLLEVLQNNAAAIAVYTKMGFQISRGLDYYVQDVDKLIFDNERAAGYELREIDLAERAAMAAMWDFIPSWQNSFDSIQMAPAGFRMTGVYDGDKLVGYGIIETVSGDIPQLAVDRAYRRKGIGSAILKSLLGYSNAAVVKVLNIEDTCTGLSAFLECHGIFRSGAQYEMIKNLNEGS